MFTVELKKLCQPILLLVALLITIVFYNQELNFIHKFWPNGSMVVTYDYASDWQDRFGPTLEAEEIEEIKVEYATLVKQADKIILENPMAKQLQLESYAEFKLWYEENVPAVRTDEMNEEEQAIVKQSDVIHQDLIDDTGHSMLLKIDVLQSLYRAMERYDSPDVFLDDKYYTEKEREKLLEVLFLEEGWRNILPRELTSTVSIYFSSIFTLVIFLLSLLIPTVFVKDRLLGLQKIQWSSRHGRNILWTQFASGMTASFLLITCIIGIFGGLLYFGDFTKYFSNGLNSFFNDYKESLLFSFYSWTFNQWIISIVLLFYLIGLSYTGILLYLAQTSQHYLSLFMKVIPVSFLFIVIAEQWLKDAFYLKNILYQWTKVPMIELYAALCLLVISISLPIVYCMRQQNKDLLR